MVTTRGRSGSHAAPDGETFVVALTRVDQLPPGEERREIWMLQFSDGSHVEFVSPAGKRRLKRNASARKPRFAPRPDSVQLALNVA